MYLLIVNKLTSLAELENEIKFKVPLPDMPTAENIKSERLNLEEMQRLQQEKIEELFIYIIELKKLIKKLEMESIQ